MHSRANTSTATRFTTPNHTTLRSPEAIIEPQVASM